MVDVLSCALGCVVLLWLVNSHEARRKAAANAKAEKELSQKTKALDEITKLLAAMTSKYKATKTDLADLQVREQSLQATKNTLLSDLKEAKKKQTDILTSWEKTKGQEKKLTDQLLASAQRIAALEDLLNRKALALAAVEKELKDQGIELRSTRADVMKLSANLAKAESDYQANLTKLTSNLTKAKSDYKDVFEAVKLAKKVNSELWTRIKSSKKTNAQLTGKLQLSAEEMAKVRKELEQATTDRGELKLVVAMLRKKAKDYAEKLGKFKAEVATSGQEMGVKEKTIAKLNAEIESLLTENNFFKLQAAASQKSLTKAGKQIDRLQSAQNVLAAEQKRLRAAVTNRFAGIQLTGKKVLFLVDVSGSMRMKDTKTEASQKWDEVCGTLGKLMKSLPDLTHYQVIAFAENLVYPLGKTGKWIPYNPLVSPGEMTKALRSIEPDGGTKMRPAFQEAFTYRKSGLDTIYLVSDGLPTDDNLPQKYADHLKTLRGVQRTTYLTTLVRESLKQLWNPPENGKVPVRINAIGYFFESPEVGAFLWALARENDGNFVGMSRP